MKKSFAKLPHPLIVGSLRHRAVNEIVEDIKKSEDDGAKAFILHIQLLDEKYQNFDSFKEIAGTTEYPIMAINYKTPNGPDDNHRIKIMREAIKAGFRSVDIPMYIYDNNAPNEVSMHPEIIVKQKELVDEFKSMGAEVLMSAHTGIELNTEQIITLVLEIKSRGADIVKIISACESKEQQLEILHGNIALKNILDIPFLYTCSGQYNRFIRFNAPLFGSMLVFGHHEYHELSNKEKPLLKDLVKYHESNYN